MIVSIQYMRAIAVLLVILYHAISKGEIYSETSWAWFNFGEAGVDLFFIISGYIMCYTTRRKRPNIYEFMKARVVRIMPLYWILTTVALAIYLVAPDKINSSGGDTSIFYSYTLLPSNSKYLIQNGWTLSYEFFYYAIFSIGLIFSATRKYVVPAVVLTILVMLGQIIRPSNVALEFMTSSILVEFVMGIAAFYVVQKYQISKNIALAFCGASIVLIAGISYWGTTGNRVIDYGIPALFLFMGLIYLEETLQNNKHHPLNQILGKIGDSSYSTYLLHPFFLAIAAIVFKKLGLANFGNLFVICLVIGSILTGWICYVTLEMPINKFIKSRTKKNIKAA